MNIAENNPEVINQKQKSEKVIRKPKPNNKNDNSDSGEWVKANEILIRNHEVKRNNTKKSKIDSAEEYVKVVKAEPLPINKNYGSANKQKLSGAIIVKDNFVDDYVESPIIEQKKPHVNEKAQSNVKGKGQGSNVNNKKPNILTNSRCPNLMEALKPNSEFIKDFLSNENEKQKRFANQPESDQKDRQPQRDFNLKNDTWELKNQVTGKNKTINDRLKGDYSKQDKHRDKNTQRSGDEQSYQQSDGLRKNARSNNVNNHSSYNNDYREAEKISRDQEKKPTPNKSKIIERNYASKNQIKNKDVANHNAGHRDNVEKKRREEREGIIPDQYEKVDRSHIMPDKAENSYKEPYYDDPIDRYPSNNLNPQAGSQKLLTDGSGNKKKQMQGDREKIPLKKEIKPKDHEFVSIHDKEKGYFPIKSNQPNEELRIPSEISGIGSQHQETYDNNLPVKVHPPYIQTLPHYNHILAPQVDNSKYDYNYDELNGSMSDDDDDYQPQQNAENLADSKANAKDQKVLNTDVGGASYFPAFPHSNLQYFSPPDYSSPFYNMPAGHQMSTYGYHDYAGLSPSNNPDGYGGYGYPYSEGYNFGDQYKQSEGTLSIEAYNNHPSYGIDVKSLRSKIPVQQQQYSQMDYSANHYPSDSKGKNEQIKNQSKS